MIGSLKAFAAGVAVGILFAPRSGRVTRQLIMDKCDDLCGSQGGPISYENGRDRYEPADDSTEMDEAATEASDEPLA